MIASQALAAVRAAIAEPVRADPAAVVRAPGAARRPAGVGPGRLAGRRGQAAAGTVTNHGMAVDQAPATTGQAPGVAAMNPSPGRVGNCRSFRPDSMSRSSRPRYAPR